MIAWAGFGAINEQVAGLYYNDGIYVAVANSVADGEDYRIASLPTNFAQTKHPFLYSLVLSFIWKLDPRFPENMFLKKGFNVACLVGIFVLTFVFYVRKVRRAEWNVLLFTTDPAYYLYIGSKAIRPGFHKPGSYFYPYGRAKPDVGLASAVKNSLIELGVRYLITGKGYARVIAALSQTTRVGVHEPGFTAQDLRVTLTGRF